jgi:hypothetical protein
MAGASRANLDGVAWIVGSGSTIIPGVFVVGTDPTNRYIVFPNPGVPFVVLPVTPSHYSTRLAPRLCPSHGRAHALGACAAGQQLGLRPWSRISSRTLRMMSIGRSAGSVRPSPRSARRERPGSRACNRAQDLQSDGLSTKGLGMARRITAGVSLSTMTATQFVSLGGNKPGERRLIAES